MDEYIKKEIVVDYLRNKLCSKCHDIEGWTLEECKHCLATEAIYSIEMANAADVKPVVRGKWLDGRCTNCAWELPDYEYYGGCEIENVSCDEFNFCPNCGADMRKETNDE